MRPAQRTVARLPFMPSRLGPHRQTAAAAVEVCAASQGCGLMGFGSAECKHTRTAAVATAGSSTATAAECIVATPQQSFMCPVAALGAATPSTTAPFWPQQQQWGTGWDSGVGVLPPGAAGAAAAAAMYQHHQQQQLVPLLVHSTPDTPDEFYQWVLVSGGWVRLKYVVTPAQQQQQQHSSQQHTHAEGPGHMLDTDLQQQKQHQEWSVPNHIQHRLHELQPQLAQMQQQWLQARSQHNMMLHQQQVQWQQQQQHKSPAGTLQQHRQQGATSTGELSAPQVTTLQASVHEADSTTSSAAEPQGCREQLPDGLGAAHSSSRSSSMTTTNTARSSSSVAHGPGPIPTCSRCSHTGHSSRQCRRACSSCRTRQGHALGCQSLWCVNCGRQGHTFEVCSQVPTSTEQASAAAAAAGPAVNTAEAIAAPAGACTVTGTAPAQPAGATSVATASDGIPCLAPVPNSSQCSPGPAAPQSAAAQAAIGEKERFQRLLQAAAASFAAGSTADCSRTAPHGETGVSKQPGRGTAGHSGMHDDDDQAQTIEQPSLDGGNSSAMTVSSNSGGSSECLSANARPDAAVQDSAGCAARVSQQVSAESYCWYDVPVMQDQCG